MITNLSLHNILLTMRKLYMTRVHILGPFDHINLHPKKPFSDINFAADCGKPALPPLVLPLPDDANTLEGAVITLVCDDDTVPEGDNKLKCGSDGRWSISNFYCRRKYFFFSFACYNRVKLHYMFHEYQKNLYF